jgi:hypothetical protein
MVRDLSKPREKLTTKHDWMIAALSQLAHNQQNTEIDGFSGQQDRVSNAIT